MKSATTVLLFWVLLLVGCSDPKAPEAAAPGAAGSVEAGGEAVTDAAFDLGEGVREALRVASGRAVDYLTGPEGIGSNAALKIPLPPSVEKLRSPLEAMGQERLLDRFSETLNTSAVEALKVSPEILEQSLEEIELRDVAELWRGGDDAFTRFLEGSARDSIRERMMPSIRTATATSGAAKTFKTITSVLGEHSGGLLGGLGALVGIELPDEHFELEEFVADEAMDRLFIVIAAEEKKLREDPVARSSEMLKSLFERFMKKSS